MAVQIVNLTFGSTIQYIARMVGHPVPTDPAGSSDPAILQMGAAINVALGEILTLHEWQDLTTRASLSVVADAVGQREKGFALPEDFYRFIDQSQWAPDTMFPAVGPISDQAWMAYSVRNWAMVMTLYWQMRNDKLFFLNPPFPNPVPFEYMYLSRAQVIDADDNNLFKNVCDKNGDKFKLDGYMIGLLARSKYLEWKGFDSSAAMRDFLAAFNSRKGSDKGATVLNMARPVGYPLISPLVNTPDTGYGI